MNKIMLSRTDRIGDVILALPVAKAIKEQYPNSKLVFLVSLYTAPILENNPYVDEVVTISGSETLSELVSIFSRHKPDILVFIFPVFKLALAALIARVPIRIGSAFRTYNLLFNRRIWENRRPSVRHESDYNLSMVHPLGIHAHNTPVPNIYLTTEERQIGADILAKLMRPRIIIHPGAVTNLERNWSVQKYFELAEKLSTLGMSVIFTGSRSEYENVKEHLASHPQFLNLMDRLSLRELMSVISASDLLISGATGPMHIAAALGIPTVSFFVPLRRHHPRRWQPLGNKHKIILPNIDCPNSCISCSHKPCLNMINSNEVLGSVIALLKEGA